MLFRSLLPGATLRPVAATRIGQDEEVAGLRVALASFGLPPLVAIFLRFMRNEYFICPSSGPTLLRLTTIRNRWRCRAIFAVVFLVHFSPLMGSPAVSCSISF